jgi:hypothetical protein
MWRYTVVAVAPLARELRLEIPRLGHSAAEYPLKAFPHLKPRILNRARNTVIGTARAEAHQVSPGAENAQALAPEIGVVCDAG